MAMSDNHGHPREALQDAIDGRLTAAEREALDAPLADCARCRRELQAMRLIKLQLARARSSELPAELESQLRRALDVEDRLVMSQDSRPFDRSIARRVAVWLSAAALVAVSVWIVSVMRSPSLPQQVADDLHTFIAGQLPLELMTNNTAELEAHFARRAALPFQPRVFDFGMMNYNLTGGGLHQLGDHSSALFAYRSVERGLAVLCLMYEGRIDTLPAPDERRVHDGIEFLVFHEGQTTVVVWQEGSVVCVLGSNDAAEAVIALARAKAVRS
jgi:hypothetical protein